MRKFEYFPIKCRTERASELYKRSHTKSGSPELSRNASEESGGKKPWKTKVSEVNQIDQGSSANADSLMYRLFFFGLCWLDKSPSILLRIPASSQNYRHLVVQS